MISSQKPPLTDEQRALVLDHLPWSQRVARGIAIRWRFPKWSADYDDIQSAAALALVKFATIFHTLTLRANESLTRQFRGMAHLPIRSACHTEAVRILNGGTYVSRNGQEFSRVFPFSCLQEDDYDKPSDAQHDPESDALPATFLAPDMLHALAMSVDLPRLGARSNGATPIEQKAIDERQFWVCLLHTHGYTFKKIAYLLHIDRDTASQIVKGSASQKELAHAVQTA